MSHRMWVPSPNKQIKERRSSIGCWSPDENEEMEGSSRRTCYAQIHTNRKQAVSLSSQPPLLCLQRQEFLPSQPGPLS